MANTTSGTTMFDKTFAIDEIIEDAFERIGLNSVAGYQLKSARRSLNILFQEWGNRGMHITTGGTVGNISYFNTSPVSGTSLFSFQVATTTKDYIDPYIPDDGVLFDAGAFIDIPAGTAVSVTTFFDG